MPSEAIEQIRDDAIPITVIIIVALVVLRFARPLIRKVLRRIFERHKPVDSDYQPTPAEVQKRVDTMEALGVSTIRFVVVLLVGVLVLAVLNLGPVIAALGLVLAAIAFAGQDFVRDYLAGIVIIVENQFYVGDSIQAAGATGTVEDFTLRRTTLRDPRRDRDVDQSARQGPGRGAMGRDRRTAAPRPRRVREREHQPAAQQCPDRAGRRADNPTRRDRHRAISGRDGGTG